jgi:hypothetical protein
LEAFTVGEDKEEDYEAVDRQLRMMNQKLLLQKEKERFVSQLEAKRKASEKLEKLNQAKEQREKIQREIDEMKEQENNSLWCDSPHHNSGQHKRTPRENFFTGNGISQFADPDSPLSLGLQTTPWPLKYKPVSLPKYNRYGNSRQFLMSYEAAISSIGGDDVALAKSFIVACEDPVLNWYSLLPPHSIYSWIDLKPKFIQAFQVFHETSAKPSDLFNCKQKDREPLQSFMRRFMQQKSQILGTHEKITIQALIKGLTPGPTTSYVTRKEPQTIEELFKELEQYIKSDKDHLKRVAERNQARQCNRGTTWRPQFQTRRNINNVENPQFNQDNRPNTRRGFASRGRGRGRRPPKVQIHDHPRDPYFYCRYHGRGHCTEACPETKKNIARI